MKTIAQLLITLKIEGVKAIISIRSYPIFCCKNVQYFICLPCIFLKRFLSFIKRCDAKMTNCHSHISNPLNPIILNSMPCILVLVWVIGDPSIHGLPFSPRPKAWTALKGSASLISVAVKVAWSIGEARSKKISQQVRTRENDDWTLYSDVDFSRL